jgi:hypothetical protein
VSLGSGYIMAGSFTIRQPKMLALLTFATVNSAIHNMKKKNPKIVAAGKKAIQTMRRKAGDAYLSGLGKKAAATKRRNRKK